MEKIHKNITGNLRATKEKYRDEVDLLLSRIGLLSGEDRLLMTMYWDKGNSLGQISELAGLNRKSIGRRIHKITERLMEGKYITCLRYREKFTILDLDIAKEYFLTGLSIKTIAGKRGWSFYRVRGILQRIQLVLELVSEDPNGELSIENGGIINADI